MVFLKSSLKSLIDGAANCSHNKRDAERVPYLQFIQLISFRKKLTESFAKTGNEPLYVSICRQVFNCFDSIYACINPSVVTYDSSPRKP